MLRNHRRRSGCTHARLSPSGATNLPDDLLGGCNLEKDYAGPKLETLEGGKFGITPQFVTEMIKLFKDGGALPRRYVWEIILGAHKHFEAEESLVKLDIEEGMTCDVIGLYFHLLPSSRMCILTIYGRRCAWSASGLLFRVSS